LAERTICSLHLATLHSERHFHDNAFCTFICNGELGFIGTLDGRVLVFSTQERVLRTLAKLEDSTPIGTMTYDERSKSLFYECGKKIHRVTLNGTPLRTCLQIHFPFAKRRDMRAIIEI